MLCVFFVCCVSLSLPLPDDETTARSPHSARSSAASSFEAMSLAQRFRPSRNLRVPFARLLSSSVHLPPDSNQVLDDSE